MQKTKEWTSQSPDPDRKIKHQYKKLISFQAPTLRLLISLRAFLPQRWSIAATLNRFDGGTVYLFLQSSEACRVAGP